MSEKKPKFEPVKLKDVRRAIYVERLLAWGGAYTLKTRGFGGIVLKKNQSAIKEWPLGGLADAVREFNRLVKIEFNKPQRTEAHR